MIDLPLGIEGLIFDCDGTLIDSMPLHKELWNVALKPHGIQVPESFIDTHAGKPTEVIVEVINAENNLSLDPEEILEAKERRFRERIAEAAPIEPVVATARHYFGKLPMAVVSGGCRKNVVLSLESLGIIDWFPVILTADDPIPHKPAPDLFLTAAKLLNVAANKCHAFEDADAGVVSAKAAGMTVTDVRDVLGVEA